MPWIELHQSVWTHRKTLKLARRLRIQPTVAVAYLAQLWTWALDNTSDGELRGCDADVIAAASTWCGEAEEFVEALVSSGYLDADPLRLHDWQQYAGKLMDRKAQNAERMRAARASHNTPPTPHVQNTCDARAAHVQDMCGATKQDQTIEDQPPHSPPPAGGGVLALDVDAAAPPVTPGVNATPAAARRRVRRDPHGPQYSAEFLQAHAAYPNRHGSRDGKAGASVSFAGLVAEEGYVAAELVRCAERYANRCRDPDARPVGIDRFYSRNASHAGKSGRIFEQYLDREAGSHDVESALRPTGGKYAHLSTRIADLPDARAGGAAVQPAGAVGQRAAAAGANP